MIVRQFLFGEHSIRIENEFGSITNGKNFRDIARVLKAELESSMSFAVVVSQQRACNAVKRIITLAQRCATPQMTTSLLCCATITPLSAALWQRLAFKPMPSVEPILVAELNLAIKLDCEIDTPLVEQAGILASVSDTFLAKIAQKILNEVFVTANSEWEAISAFDIAVTETPEGELFDTNVIRAKEKQLDKNSKNYEEEKWAMEMKKKQEAKSGTGRILENFSS